ncbi:MAG: cupin domain-containing protein [Streptosporangiaceae bacterium]
MSVTQSANQSATPVRSAQVRRTETPNAVMTTFASPTQGASQGLSLWQVDMRAGQRGPEHVFDSEQVWHVQEGEAQLTVDGQAVTLAAGDSLVLPAGAARQVSAATAVRIVVCGHGSAVVTVPGEAQSRGTPPWIG